jgi:hypothetical protein
MVETVVRCPYCVCENQFREMVAHLDGRLICRKCGHMSRPKDPSFKCICPKCREMSFPAGLGWIRGAS